MTPGSRGSTSPSARAGVAQRTVARKALARAASGASREQLQLVALADGGPRVVHAELGVDVFLVGANGVQGHDKFMGDFGTAQVGGEKAEDVQLAFAQWVEQGL